ncbi:MAG: hypothetical protein K1X68_00255 [Saprospiraceae bacterium]|nr:hypothetical protein [Saprospiraceae bacterium]HMX89686.1 hypothetical protein [Saprospiraceae bacterium]HNC37679.1 hypothetical protein [Saprospiraceae bacterium]HNG70266.1 hypothetical protein [Saprospiraceae bacterium]
MKKFSLKSIGEQVIPVAEMGAGFALAKVVPALYEKIAKPAAGKGLSNTVIGVGQIGVGLFLAGMIKNKHIKNVAVGVAISGAHTFLKDPVDKAIETAGLNAARFSQTPLLGTMRTFPNANMNQMGCAEGRQVVK